jgi:hypothetical protein
MCRIRSRCCARAASGQAAAPPSSADAPHPLGLLCPRRERPRCRAAEQRDEVAAFQLIELHSFPPAKGRVTGYRIASDQSAGMLEFCNHSWFCLRWRRPPATHSAR